MSSSKLSATSQAQVNVHTISVTVTVTVLKNHFSAFQALQYNNITVLKNQKQGGFVVYDSNSPPLSSYFQLFFVLLTIICAICRYYKYETTENNDLRMDLHHGNGDGDDRLRDTQKLQLSAGFAVWQCDHNTCQWLYPTAAKRRDFYPREE